MKKISITILTLATLWAGTGCKKALDKTPQAASVEENFYQTDQDLLAASVAAYSNLSYEGDGSIYVPLWAYGDIPSDDARKGSSLTDIPYWNQNETFTSNPDDPGLIQVWTQQYLGIHRANLVLQHAPTAPQASQKIKDQVQAEAKFLRAYYHFYLLRMFGWNQGIPLVTSILEPGQFEVGRSSKEDVFAQIEKDLIDAAAVLPEKGGIEVGRADKGAALGLLTRVYLFESKWHECLTTAQSVMALTNKYSLLPIIAANSPDSAFAAIFSAKNNNNAESVFAIQFMSENNGNWFGTTGSITQVMTRGRNNKGWGFNVPTQNLVNEFESGDPRLKGTVFSNGDQMFYNEKFAAPDPTQYPYEPYGTRKYIENYLAIASNLSDNGTNYILVRYADILLMAAEAANNLQQDALAQTYLNQVRERAGMSDVTSSGTALHDAIWHERRVELAQESLRFFDLVRQGRAAKVLQATGDNNFQEGKLFREGVNEAFPIPQSEINLSQGKLTQNNGY